MQTAVPIAGQPAFLVLVNKEDHFASSLGEVARAPANSSDPAPSRMKHRVDRKPEFGQDFFPVSTGGASGGNFCLQLQ